MSIELPGGVADFLNLIGVAWPGVDEDQVRAFAGHVRAFAGNLADTHDAATATVRSMNAAYQGSSYERLVETWARMSTGHMRELIDGCHVVADAMGLAADAITAAKVAAIAELAAMVIAFAADQAAAFVTFGASEAAEPLIIGAARTLVSDLERELEQQVIGEVIGKAVEPLEAIVTRAAGGLVFGASASLAGLATPGNSFGIMPGELRGYAGRLQGHADDIAGHARGFAQAIEGVSFGG